MELEHEHLTQACYDTDKVYDTDKLSYDTKD